MDGTGGYKVSAVFFVEVLKIGQVSEIVRVDLAALGVVAGLDVIGVLDDLMGEALCRVVVTGDLMYLGMRGGGSRDGDGGAVESGVIDIGIDAVRRFLGLGIAAGGGCAGAIGASRRQQREAQDSCQKQCKKSFHPFFLLFLMSFMRLSQRMARYVPTD